MVRYSWGQDFRLCCQCLFCVLSTGVNGQVQLGAGLQAVLRCKWSGTAGGRISGCVDKVYSVCYLQV